MSLLDALAFLGIAKSSYYDWFENPERVDGRRINTKNRPKPKWSLSPE